MSRSERYIPPSEEELQRQQQAFDAAEKCDTERYALLRASLQKVKKEHLVELMLRVAQVAKAAEWMVERELELDKPVHLLVNDTEVAIEIATRVDEHQLNHNFDYDQSAYEAVRRNLTQLIQKDRIKEAQRLALKLMEKGSYQIECSNEGLMLEEIEGCLRLVISAVAVSPDAGEWALEMLQHDRVRFICEHELTEMAGLVKSLGRQRADGRSAH